MFVGGMAGGVIVDYLGSKAGKALFSSCLGVLYLMKIMEELEELKYE